MNLALEQDLCSGEQKATPAEKRRTLEYKVDPSKSSILTLVSILISYTHEEC